MRSPSSPGCASSKLALAACLLTLPILYYVSYQAHLRHPLWSWDASWPSLRLQKFADRWLSTELLEPFDASAIRTYCAASEWRPNLVFNLQGCTGGVGNVRAAMLDFIFFAIEAGAAIVLPGMTVRSDDDLFDVWHGAQANFSRMFDEEHFLTTMADVCPQMRMYQPGELEESSSELNNIREVLLMRSRREDFNAANTRIALRMSVDGWLRDRGVSLNNTQQTTIVNLDRTMWEVDTRSLPPSLRLSFPMLLRVNPTIRRFASLAMESMASQYNVHIRSTDQLHEQAFYGAHLRTEADTVSAGWFNPPTEREFGLDFEAQTDSYLNLSSANDLHLMYVATGNESEFDRFVSKAATVAPSMTLFNKYTLLSDEDGAALRKLEWDQQALVDLEILKRCSVFGGFAKSSFSFMIAVARQAYLETQGRSLGRAWYMREVDKHVAFDDDLSRVLGRNELNERKVPRGNWP